jgi:hypothetical protein
MLGLRFEDDETANRIKRLVLAGSEPAALSAARFELEDFLHDVLPGAACASRVARLPINPRQMQAERGRFVGFVLGCNEAKGFVLIAGVKGFLFLCDEVFVVISASPSAEHTIALFHLMSHSYEHEPSEENPVSE